MSTTKNVLNGLIVGKYDYCCLCLKPHNNDAVLFQDEVVFDKTLISIKIVDLLRCLVNYQFLLGMSPYSAVCNQCKKSAIDSYKFIQMCKNNNYQLKKTVDSVTQSLPSPRFVNSFKSVYISLNIEELKSEAYCDNKRHKLTSSCKTILKRFQALRNKNKKFDLEDPALHFGKDVCYSPETTYEDRNNIINPIKKSSEIPKNRTISINDIRLSKNNYKCKYCMKIYRSAQHLRQHYFRVHAEKIIKCSECPRSYSTKTLLEEHRVNSHTPAICSECGKTYNNRYSLKMHETGHNTKIICSNCGRTYKHQRTFKKHIENVCGSKERRSNKEAKFICDHCNKRFSNKPTLRVHITFEHGNGKTYVCRWCSKKFYAQSRLNAHIVKHTQEKNFSCELCGGKFVTKESLKYHTRIHTGERPYQCHICESRFISSSRRSDHIKRHHTTSLLECEICGSKLKNHSSLIKHKKRHFNPESTTLLRK